MGGNSLIYCHHVINSPFLTERVTSSGRKKADPLERQKGRGKKPWFLPLYSDRQRTRASLGHEFFVSCPNGLADGWTTRMHDEKTGRRKTSTSKFRVSRQANKLGRRRFLRKSPVLRVRQFPLNLGEMKCEC